MLPELLGCVLPACKAGLEDPDDDVRAVAADALLPTAASIVALNGQLLHSIIMLLWDILLDLDDLSPSTSRQVFIFYNGSSTLRYKLAPFFSATSLSIKSVVMNLLAEIYSQEQMIPKTFGEKKKFDLNEIDRQDDLGGGTWSSENPYMLSTLAPRLWPFMRHSITSVRYSAIRTLERLLEAEYKRSIAESTSSFWPSFILGDTLRIVFQNLLLESNEEIVQCSGRVWRILLQGDMGKAEFSSSDLGPQCGNVYAFLQLS
ncbi:TATA-binding protein-associated factor BTAF1 [Capsicum chinense]|nr:TATA-binding protein-associated factor BTAF1 [Capsicum chinense]